jgi:FMN phosphatase YigB (HAD superfamily)
MKPYKALIFDLFDTLVDFDRAQIPMVKIDDREIPSTAGETYKVLAQHDDRLTFEAYYRLLSTISKELAATRNRDYIEIPARRRFEQLFDRLRLPRDTAGEACIDAMLATHHHHMVRATVSPPERLQVVEALKPRYPLAILSNFDSAQTGLRILDRHALSPHFHPIHISEAIRYRKPRAEAFLGTVAAMGVIPQEVLFIGDTFALDVVGAKRVGMDVAWFDRKKTPPDLTAAKPDYVISGLPDLLKIL